MDMEPDPMDQAIVTSAPSHPPTPNVAMDASSIKDKIIYTLTLQLRMTATTLQAALGPFIPPKLWRPQLQQLIDDKSITVVEFSGISQNGRWRSMTFYTLSVYKDLLNTHFPLS